MTISRIPHTVDIEKSYKPRGTKKAREQLATLRQRMRKEAEKDIKQATKERIVAEKHHVKRICS